MRGVALLAIGIGLIAGIVGGFWAGAFWLGVGAALEVVGFSALWLLAVQKDWRAVVKGEMEVDAMASGYPPTAELPPQRSVEPQPPIELVQQPRPAQQLMKNKRA